MAERCVSYGERIDALIRSGMGVATFASIWAMMRTVIEKESVDHDEERMDVSILFQLEDLDLAVRLTVMKNDNRKGMQTVRTNEYNSHKLLNEENYRETKGGLIQTNFQLVRCR